jgi:hypothetical protein
MVVGPAVFLIMPVFIGALAEEFAFDNRQLGFMGSADLAGLGQIICFLVMMRAMGAATFLVSLAFFQFFWNFALPYHMGVIIHRDPSASFIVLVPTFQAIGIALGPALAGLAVAGGSYSGVNLVSILALLVYLVMVLPFSRIK